MVFIGNGEYLPRGYVPRRRPRLDTGRLDVRIVESTGRESAWRLLGQALSGQLVRDRRYSACQPERLDLVLDTDEPTLACDGEVVPTDREIAVSVERQALTVYHRPPRSRR
jgi:undecaprenyl-diphosphatase